MAIDLDQFSEEPIEFTVEHEGKTATFYVEPTSLSEFAQAIKRPSQGLDSNMRRTFSTLLLDENKQPVKTEWIDKLLTRKNLIPFALKINAALNSAIGLDDIVAKKG